MIFGFLGTFLIRSIGYFVQSCFMFWENKQSLLKYGPGVQYPLKTAILKLLIILAPYVRYMPSIYQLLLFNFMPRLKFTNLPSFVCLKKSFRSTWETKPTFQHTVWVTVTCNILLKTMEESYAKAEGEYIFEVDILSSTILIGAISSVIQHVNS